MLTLLTIIQLYKLALCVLVTVFLTHSALDFESICQLQNISFDFSGCLDKVVSYKNKSYAIYTIPSTGLDLDDAFHFCQQLLPARELVLPVDAESNNVVHDLVKQSQ